jgi:hypothetical protein
MAPPENAIVICVDEKPSIQALERAQGYLKLPNGRALTGHSHDYKRNGTSTLFAAFEVATGKVTAAHKTRRRRIKFLDFMNDIVAAHADAVVRALPRRFPHAPFDGGRSADWQGHGCPELACRLQSDACRDHKAGTSSDGNHNLAEMLV